jgi:type IV pilus assembly protein PilY1
VAPQQEIKTFVVGFALNSLTVASQSIDCSTLTADNLDATCTAHPESASLQACCNLARIAIAGDTDPKRHAFFANDREELRKDISTVLSEALPATSRTQAAFSAASGSMQSALAPAASYRFFSAFSPVLLQPWSGQVTRERWICNDAHQPTRVAPDPIAGDSFADNLNSAPAGRARTFYTVQPANGGAFPDRSLRPNLGGLDLDGVGTLTGALSSGQASTFVANTTPTSMGLSDTSCTITVGTVVSPQTAAQCRDKYLKWLLGLDNGTIYSRCPKGVCNLLGDIYHATPRIVNAPRELTSDDTYQTFQSTYATRPLMLYTSSNDGMLHAFKVASNQKDDQELIDSKKNNELWAFIPPEVLPHIYVSYPYTHQLLLDGVSVVKDVIARKVGAGYTLDRSQADSSALSNATWRTILVQSFGSQYPGYFALDITNPDPTMTIDSQAGGPRFLWQITSDANGAPLFGTGGATPIITTVDIDEFGTGDIREVAVAVLPGGSAGAGGAGTGGGCARATPTSVLGSSKFGSYSPRGFVPCYTTDLGARSLTIVRLDTGKIIRTFRRSKTELPSAIQPSVSEAPLDSPITGEPVAFPTDVGSIAERIFVGDQDGTLWKADVSNKAPDQWTMSLFWDAFPNVSIHSQGVGTWNGGQPIATAPLLSVDANNNLTIAVSTGSQGNLGAAPGMLNYVWSLRDLPDASHVFSPDLLWVEQLLDGERVTGPMSLFNSYLYFSTVTPPAANTACKSTNGARVWGMHYLTPRDGEGTTTAAAVRDVGGLPAPFIKANFNSTNQYVTDTELLGTSAQNQAVIYGVTVAQVPTCYTTDTASDALGGTKISNVNPGKFQLLVQTGAASLGTGGQAEAAAPPGAVAITLPSLATPARVEAWAALVE